MDAIDRMRASSTGGYGNYHGELFGPLELWWRRTRAVQIIDLFSRSTNSSNLVGVLGDKGIKLMVAQHYLYSTPAPPGSVADSAGYLPGSVSVSATNMSKVGSGSGRGLCCNAAVSARHVNCYMPSPTLSFSSLDHVHLYPFTSVAL